MAIVRMSAFHLYVLNEQVPSLLRQLQEYGNVTFKDISTQVTEPFVAAQSDYDFDKNLYQQEHIQSVLASIERFEKKQKRKKKPLSDDLNVTSIAYSELEKRAKNIEVESILNIFDENYDAQNASVEDYQEYKPWNQRRMEQDKLIELRNAKPFIGTVSKEKRLSFVKEIIKKNNIYYMVKDVDNESIFVLLIPKKEMEQVKIIAEKYDFEMRSAKSLQIHDDVKMMIEKLELFIEKRETLENRFGSIGNVKQELQLYYEYLRNEELSYRTISKFLKSDHITIIAGWVETKQEATFQTLIETSTHGVAHLDIQPAANDSQDVPIKLKNNKFNQVFETITNMYSKPRYNELDPTPFLAPFYALFFGMMLADIGYGILMGIAAFLVLRFVKLKTSSEQLVRFLFVLSFPTIIWGFIYGSFFGGIIPMTPILNIQRDFNTVLVMSLCFGIVHLFFGLALKGYLYIRDSEKRFVLYDVIFWYLALIGAIVLVTKMFTDAFDAYSQIATIMMVVGMVGIVLTNGRDAKTIPGKFASGLYSLYGITNYVGDIVSYSRLMALGLAGGSIAMAFNMIVEMLSQFGILGILFGAIVFIIGQGFNLFISGLSAYVHSARLTYVEFFGKFYSGGGKPFEQFRAKPTYIEIKE